MVKILRKSHNYQLCHSGEYGNRVRQWGSISEWNASGYKGDVAMRVDMGAGGGPSMFNVSPGKVPEIVKTWCLQYDLTPDKIKLSEMADSPRILQGEYFNGIYELDGQVRHGAFLYTRESGPMPLALKRASSNTYGLAASLLLKGAMTPASYEDWQGLLERYPNHVLEVSVWDRCLGDMPHRNSIVWEVRMY